jgi:lysophospholipase L1-like esterase
MYRMILFLLAFNVSVSNIFSQCSETNEPKVLLIGDSWAFFMFADQTFNNVFAKWGFSNYKYVSNGTIAENGAQTDDFLKPEKLAEIKLQLNQNPTIEVVHFSIGGNDVLGEWKKSWPSTKTDSLKTAVEARLQESIDSIKSYKPGIRIVWSGYTYPNFEEIIQTFAAPSSHPFYGTWDGMEKPSFIQINTILNEFSGELADYAASDPQVDFVPATGILQYTFGQSTPLGVAPGGTYAQYSVPLTEGKPEYPSPRNSMRDYLSFVKDAFHLSPKGYEDFIGYQFQKFYHKFFMDDKYLLAETGSKTGSVSSQGSVSDSLYLGESAGEQFATVLSFNTTSMVDSSAASASIFLRRNNLSGTNPITGNLEVKIKNGNFGASATIEASDYADAPQAFATPCLFGSNTAGNWIRLDLPATILPYIINDAATQFIISAPGFTGGKASFYGAADPDFAPVLNITYGSTVGIKEKPVRQFAVYPNPTDNYLNIDAKGETILNVEVADLVGKVVMKQTDIQKPVNISAIPSGIYLLNITTDSGKTSQRILKN